MAESLKVRLKKCNKCGSIKPLDQFGTHKDTYDGRQSYCLSCKQALNKRARTVNVAVRLKHHIATRIQDQLGSLTPESHYKHLEQLLGYKLPTLVRHLRAELDKREPGKKLRVALEEGYHVDHIYPLSKFPVISGDPPSVDWEEFRRCWRIENLVAIPAEENLRKGTKVER